MELLWAVFQGVCPGTTRSPTTRIYELIRVSFPYPQLTIKLWFVLVPAPGSVRVLSKILRPLWSGTPLRFRNVFHDRFLHFFWVVRCQLPQNAHSYGLCFLPAFFITPCLPRWVTLMVAAVLDATCLVGYGIF